MGQAKQRGPRELRMAQSIERKRVEAEAARAAKLAENERLRERQEALDAALLKRAIVLVPRQRSMRTLHVAAMLGMAAISPTFIIADELENKDEP